MGSKLCVFSTLTPPKGEKWDLKSKVSLVKMAFLSFNLEYQGYGVVSRPGASNSINLIP